MSRRVLTRAEAEENVRLAQQRHTEADKAVGTASAALRSAQEDFRVAGEQRDRAEQDLADTEAAERARPLIGTPEEQTAYARAFISGESRSRRR